MLQKEINDITTTISKLPDTTVCIEVVGCINLQKKYSLGADQLLPCEQQEYSFVGLPVNLLWLKNGKLSLISAESRVYTVTVYTEAFAISTNPSPLFYGKFEVWSLGQIDICVFEVSSQTFCKILPYVSMLQWVNALKKWSSVPILWIFTWNCWFVFDKHGL